MDCVAACAFIPLVQLLFNFVIIFFHYSCLAQNEWNFQKAAVMFTKLQVILFMNCTLQGLTMTFRGKSVETIVVRFRVSVP